jgi:hypothetical protein
LAGSEVTAAAAATRSGVAAFVVVLVFAARSGDERQAEQHTEDFHPPSLPHLVRISLSWNE